MLFFQSYYLKFDPATFVIDPSRGLYISKRDAINEIRKSFAENDDYVNRNVSFFNLINIGYLRH